MTLVFVLDDDRCNGVTSHFQTIIRKADDHLDKYLYVVGVARLTKHEGDLVIYVRPDGLIQTKQED